MVQVYTYKTASTLIANATVAYLVYVILLKVKKKFRSYLIDHEYNFSGLLPVSRAADFNVADENDGGNKRYGEIVPLLEEFRSTSHRDGTDFKLQVLQNAMKKVLASLNRHQTYGFEVKEMGMFWVCYVIITSYCCNIPDSKDMSKIKQNGTFLLCVRCLSTCKDIEALLKAPQCRATEVGIAYFKTLKINCGCCQRLKNERTC